MSLKTAFDAQMNTFQLPPHAPIAIGVSGGADSMALTLLLKQWAQTHGHPLYALTVNHLLRPDSTKEAEQVAAWMADMGINHTVLTWTGNKPTTRIEERAREARYKLLSDFCAAHQIKYLCLAHHAGDQSETFLSRLARGSGVDGLAGMNVSSKRGELILLRPLLSFDKDQLVELLICNQVRWVEDPMNADETYERVRWRNALPQLKQTGLSADFITLSAKRLGRAAQALNQYANDFIMAHVSIDKRGFALIDKDAFKKAPDEIKIRVLGKLIEAIGYTQKPLSYARLEKIALTMPLKTTLGACHIITHKRGIFIVKEADKMPAPLHVPAGKTIKWDKFLVRSDLPGVIAHGAPTPREKGIPYLVQQSFPYFSLEKNTKLDYKDLTTYIELHSEFLPQNKG